MMRHLRKEDIDSYTNGLNEVQQQTIIALRDLVLTHDSNVKEKIIEDKWLNGYLGYYSPKGNMVYAIGSISNDITSFHMMPLYVSNELREKYIALLKPYMSGRSSLNLKTLDNVNIEAITDIIRGGSKLIDEAMGS